MFIQNSFQAYVMLIVLGGGLISLSCGIIIAIFNQKKEDSD
jgi:hypothetical protein